MISIIKMINNGGIIMKITKKHFNLTNNTNVVSSNYAESSVLLPCIINICESKSFKDGTKDYLIFGTFVNSTSKERPSLGKVRANSIEEAIEKAQEILDNNLHDFLKKDLIWEE